MNSNILEFYRAVRQDQPLFDQLVTMQDPDQLVEALLNAGSAFGFDLTQDDVRQGLNSLTDIIAEVGNDEELTDFELEFVSAGGGSVSSNPV